MKTLNLVNKGQSDVDFEISPFPDGQQQVTVRRQSLYNSTIITHAVTIKSRLNNFKDLELIVCAVMSLKNCGVKEIHLYVPYFLGSRSDRKFEEGGNNYLKQVICPMINRLEFESVTVIDPHSDVLEACLNNFIKISNFDFILGSLQSLFPKVISSSILLSPDAGATKKIYDLAKRLQYEEEIITCGKNRDVKGNITETIVPHFDLTKDVIIIDDICDGGKTFIEIAKVIKLRHEQYLREKDEIQAPGKIILMVTHGIFSKGFSELDKYFDVICCTNSYKDIKDLGILCGQHSTRSVGDLVKQFNIF